LLSCWHGRKARRRRMSELLSRGRGPVKAILLNVRGWPREGARGRPPRLADFIFLINPCKSLK